VGVYSDPMKEWWPYIDAVPWLQGRDLILMDQRGAGLSEASLDRKRLDLACSSRNRRGSSWSPMVHRELVSGVQVLDSADPVGAVGAAHATCSPLRHAVPEA
jgi:hypothetical protein